MREILHAHRFVGTFQGWSYLTASHACRLYRPAGPGLAVAGALASAAAVQAAAAGSPRSTAIVPATGPPVHSPRPRSEWELDPLKIAIGRRLAVGGFGEVFLAKYEGTLVAVKRLLATDSGELSSCLRQRYLWEWSVIAFPYPAGTRYPD